MDGVVALVEGVEGLVDGVVEVGGAKVFSLVV